MQKSSGPSLYLKHSVEFWSYTSTLSSNFFVKHVPRPLTNEFVHCKLYITSVYVLDVFSDHHIPLNVVWYLVYNEWHTTSGDEQIKAIFHLVLQVYCSPSLKEYPHNPVMPLLARTIQRKVSILHAHAWCVCACVCVVVMCEYMHACVLHVDVWTCVHIHLCKCIQNGGYKFTRTCISNHISAIEQVWQLLMVWWGSC